MQHFNKLLSITILNLFLATNATQIWAAPGFELDLKELKKPTSLPATEIKKAPSESVQKKHGIPAKKQTQMIKKTKAASPKLALTSTVPPSELSLKGGNACQLAEQMAVAVARSVSAAPLLKELGLDLKPVATVKHDHLTVLITCGISPAEAYTFSRLLEQRQIYLINIEGHETTAQVARNVINALALPYRRENDEYSKEGELIYVFPVDQERRRPLRLTLQP